MIGHGACNLQDYTAEFEIHGALTKLPNSRRGEHWGQALRQRKRWEKLIGQVPLMRPLQPLTNAILIITRLSVATKSPDQDNMIASLKPVIDALVSQRFLLDDSTDILHSEVNWKRVTKRKDQGTLIRITGTY